MKKRIQVVYGIAIVKTIMRVIDSCGYVRFNGKSYPVYNECGENRIQTK